MKKPLLKATACFLLIFLTGASGFAQLTGTKTIPGDYATIALAITDLNAQGVGAGGVTFNVAAGNTETFASPTAGLITATGTLSNQIVFQKSGSGANPVITSGIGVSTSVDGIIVIKGGDYITFDGIDLLESAANITATTQMEWGYAFVKASATDGSQYNVIKNCVVTLKKSNTFSACVYAGNHTDAITTALTVSAVSGANSYNKIYGNTLSNSYKVISINGYNDLISPYLYYDQNNEIGVTAGNIISNYAGSTFAVQAIYTIYQNNIKIANNTITGGSATTGTLYGIYTDAGLNANGEIYNNNISLSPTGTTSNVVGIGNNLGGTGTTNTVSIHDNTIENILWTTATTGVFYGIRNYVSTGANPLNLNIYNNSIRNNTMAGTGAMNLFYNGASAGTNNVNIYSNSIYGNQKSGASGTMYCIYSTTAIVSVHDNLIYNNTIPTTSGASAGIIYGYYNFGSPTAETIYLNTIYGLSVGGTTTATTSIVRGIYTNTTAAAIKSIYSNQVYNLSITTTGGGTVDGVYQALGAPTNIYKNTIYNLSASAVGGMVNGIYVVSGTTNNVFNNLVSDLKTPAATGANAVNGIYISGGTTANLFYNTIYLDASSTGATFGSSGIYKSSTTTGDFRNNIVVNNSVPGVTSGNTVAYRWSGVYNASYYAATSNNNDFYAGTPAANRLIFFDGTNSDQTLAAYKSRVAPRDAVSLTENPPFINVAVTPYNLHLSTSVATQCESAGQRITTPIAITDDVDGNTRFGETGYAGTGAAPDLGADEGNFILLDLTPPTITYTALANTSSVATRTITATITDASAVGTGANQPVLYWAINAGAYTGPVVPTSVVGNQYTYTLGAGVVTGDIVKYYFVAQDQATTPNVGSAPSGAIVTASPPLASAPPAVPSTYTILGCISGTKTVGVTGDYITLTAAIADLNSKELCGPLTLALLDASYSASETFPIIINSNTGSSATNTILIKPNAGVASTVTGSSAGPIIKIDGADYVTIDGINVGGSSLLLENTNVATTSSVIWNATKLPADAASNNTITNCALRGNAPTTTFGCFISSGSVLGGVAEALNNNIAFKKNIITRSQYGIAVVGPTGNETGLLITENTLGSTVAGDKLGLNGIAVFQQQNADVSKNTILGVVTSTSSTASGIRVSGTANGITISKNKITDVKNTNTTGWGSNGIQLNSSSPTANVIVVNNFISDVASYGYSSGSTVSDNGYGIIAVTGGGYNIYLNSVLLNTNQTVTGIPAAVNITSGITLPGSIDLRDNIFANTQTIGTDRYAIYSGAASSVFLNINYNDYYTTGPNIGNIGASNKANLAAWQAATAQDLNSVSGDPLFVSSADLHLNTTMNSPAKNAGYHVVILPTATDIDDENRNDPPDMGADDYSLTPTIVTTAATSVLGTTATINGTITANNESVGVTFQYGTTLTFGTTVTGIPTPVTGNTATPVSYNLTGLVPNTTYYFQVVGTVGSFVYNGVPPLSFTTAAVLPTVTTDPATSVTSTGAIMNGTVNANNSSTAVSFEYGLTTGYGTTVTGVPSPVTGVANTAISYTLTGLVPNTTYHYRAVGVNSAGTANGLDLTFTTPAILPTVVTDAATTITGTAAVLNGTVNANNASTAVTFEYGLTSAYGTTVSATPSPVTGTSNTAVSYSLGGLVPNTTYHFRVVGVNTAGTANGLDLTFTTTAILATVTTDPATSVTAITAVLNGTVNANNDITDVTFEYGLTTAYGAIVTASPSPVNGTSNTAVNYSLSGLSANTTYHFRVVGINTAGTANGNDLSFTTPAAAPLPQYYNYNTNGSNNSFPFNIAAGKEVQLLYLPGDFNTPSLSPAGIITSIALRIGDTYPLGPWDYTDLTIKMGQAASLTTFNTGELYTGPLSTVYYHATTSLSGNAGQWMTIPLDTPFSYDPTQSLIVEIGQCGVPAGTGFSMCFTSLTDNRRNWSTGGCPFTYGGQNSAVYHMGINMIAGTAPTVVTTAATSVSTNSATLNGTVNANNQSSTVTFEYGLTTAYGTTVSGVPGTVTGTTVTPVSAAISGLTQATLYHFRAVAVNATGSTPGNDMTFTTDCPIPAAAGVITGPASICQSTNGVAFSVGTISNATSYVWTLPTGATIATGTGTSSITVDFGPTAASGDVSVYGSSGCASGASSSKAVTLNARPVPVITGSATACVGSTGNVYSTTAGMTGYTWTVSSGGTITAGAGTNTITVSWNTVGGENVYVNYTNAGSCAATTPSVKSVTVNPLPVPTISGLASVCAGTTGVTYTTESGMTGYTWTVSAGGTITAGTGTNGITVTWNAAGSQNVYVNYLNGNGCTAALPTVKSVTVNALPVPTITGLASVCVGTAGVTYTTETGMTGYTWTVSSGGIITTGAGTNAITVTWNTVGSQNVYVNYTNANGCSATIPAVKSVTVNPLPVPTISGLTSVCVGTTGVTYTTEASMTGYTWTVSAGGTITAGAGTNTITVLWSTVGAKNVYLNYVNANGCTATTPSVISVTVNALPVPTITGATFACAGSAGVTYTTEAGMTGYTWTVSAGGTITAGAGTNGITVSWNTAGLKNVYVNYVNTSGCSALTPSVFIVNVAAGASPTITGPVELCAGSTGVVYTTEPGFTNYIWTISYGGMITSGLNSNVITVDWNTAGQRYISVNYTNTSGCGAVSPYTHSVTVLSVPVPIISGDNDVCQGTTGVTYTTQLNNTGYVWTVSSGGTITSGAGTNAITVSWNAGGNQTVGVIYSNSLGCEALEPTIFNVTVAPKPVAAGTITGSASVCAGATGVIYTVPAIANATSYSWTVPTGATIVSGAATNAITVSFALTASSGIIKVNGVNDCGTGASSPNFNVVVNPLPSTPVITQHGDTLTSSAATGNQWYLDGVIITGATGQQHIAVYTGTYTVVVTTNGCSSAISNGILVLPVSVTDFELSHSFDVYPNPNQGQFNIKVISTSPVQLNIEIYNSLGALLWSQEKVNINGTYITPVSLAAVPNGVYMVALRNMKTNIVRKVVIMK